MNSEMIRALADPAGAPSHPVLFLVLGVVTFALHMTAVNVMIGSLFLALRGAFSKDANWQRLSLSMGFVSKTSVSIALVLGVAPLLFVQVIYDPFWYASNVISAWWTLIFLAVMTVGYLALHRFNCVNHDHHGQVAGKVWLIVAFIAMLACGHIMHSIANQALLPGNWMQWYAPNGEINTSGRGLYYISHPRVTFFLMLSGPVIAAWIYGMRRYLLTRGESDVAYTDFMERVADRCCLIGTVIATLCYVLWMFRLPESMSWFAGSFWVVLPVLCMGIYLAMPFIHRKGRLCSYCNYTAFVAAIVVTLLIGVAREVLRFGTLLDAVGWNPMDYKITMDWSSTVIFFVTFLVVGGLNVAYLLMTSWKAGLSKGGYVANAGMNKLGNLALGSIVVWIAGWFILGLLVTFNII